MDPQEIITRLGVKAVLLPIRKGTKAPSNKGWQNTKFESTQNPLYQSALAKASTIGVLLGDASEGLCSIDFDCSTALEQFLAANPRLQGSLRTTGKRGANVWLVINREIPPSRKLTSGGKPIGEWRAKGSHTIIAGKHIDGGVYSRIVNAPPVHVKYKDIVWPWNESAGVHRGTEHTEHTEHTDCSDSTDDSDNSDCSGKRKAGKKGDKNRTLGDRIKARDKAMTELQRNRRLHHLYQTYIAKRFSPTQGKRNSDLIDMVTFLFHAVGTDTLIELVAAFYDVNQDIFADSREQHMAEATAHLDACKQTWVDKLPPDQRRYVSDLPEPYQAAFRICRDLAYHKAEPCIAGQFFLSYHELSIRIGTTQRDAERLLRIFAAQRWLNIIVKGTMHRPGHKGLATTYRWLLPVLTSIILLFSFHRLFYTHLIRQPEFVATATASILIDNRPPG